MHLNDRSTSFGTAETNVIGRTRKPFTSAMDLVKEPGDHSSTTAHAALQQDSRRTVLRQNPIASLTSPWRILKLAGFCGIRFFCYRNVKEISYTTEK